jgi:hypothetical protein
MTTHRLKCLPEFFHALWSGEKTFEVRRDDRGFRSGDHLMLAEWDEQHGYSGREITVEVTLIMSGMVVPGVVLPSGVVVMAIREVSRLRPEVRP